MASLNKPPFIMWRGPLFKLLPPTLLPLDLEGGGEEATALHLLRMQKGRIKLQVIHDLHWLTLQLVVKGIK